MASCLSRNSSESFLTSRTARSLRATLTLICEKMFLSAGPSGRCYFLRCVLSWPRLPAFPARLALCFGQPVTLILVLSWIFGAVLGDEFAVGIASFAVA